MPFDANDRAQLEKYYAILNPALVTTKKMMRAINGVYDAADVSPVPFPDVDNVAAATGGDVRQTTKSYGPTEFYPHGLAPVVRRLLTDNPYGLDIDQLYEFMRSGGFAFKETNPEKAKANLKISLGKYTQFDRTPNGYYVLSTKAPKKAATKDGKDDTDDDESDEPAASATASPTTERPRILRERLDEDDTTGAKAEGGSS